MEPFIRMKNLKFKYKGNENDKSFYVLNNINLDIKSGEFVAIIGRNGCGKSTLAKHFNALFLPSEGKVFIDNMDTSDESQKYDIRCNVGLVLQNPDNQMVSTIVEEDVAFGPENLGILPEEIRKKVNSSLDAVNMIKYKNCSTNRLSGGQKQKVAIAGILAMKPRCIVFDEPTSMLDPICRKEILNIIKKLNKDNKITIILITHYMNEAILADRIIIMEDGKIVADDETQKIFSSINLLKKYGLSVPQSIELIEGLKAKGYNIKSGVLSEDECVYALDKLLRKT